MRYENPINTPDDKSEYHPLVYVHLDGQETRFDLQQVRYDNDQTPRFVVSESPLNQGPGFDDVKPRRK